MPSLSAKTLTTLAAGLTLLLLPAAGLPAQTTPTQTAPTPAPRTLAPDTRFFVPPPAAGSIEQVYRLFSQGRVKDGLLIAGTEFTPQAVWLTGGTPEEVGATVAGTLAGASREHATPTFVLYNIPGRDCGSYSAGGAQNTGAYQAWIDGIAQAVGNQQAVFLVEPDALANLPSDCGYPATVDAAQLTADRYTQVHYAVSALEQQPAAVVYLDAGNSDWHAVGDMALRLATAGVAQAQGFFSNVSNYRLSAYETHFDTWVSECLAFANNPADGGWRLGHYTWCASQYYSPLGPVDPNNIATWTYTDQWYTQNLGAAAPATHFVVDTSRNGQGPLDATVYAAPPYNQPAAVVQTIASGSWCNPPGRGLGARPTANTGVPLLDAYLWVKTPGQSDGSCDAAGGARAWDYTLYSQPGWPTDPAAQAIFDPLWGLDDPAAGAWFPQQALDLARRANPPLFQF